MKPRARSALILPGAIAGGLLLAAASLFLPASTALADSNSFGRALSLGSTGPDVSALQQFLKNRGFFPLSQTTDYFGPKTKVALSKFQTSVGLEGVGQVGPKTLALLNGSASTIFERPLYPRLSGPDVSALQQFLKVKGFYAYRAITGYYGPVTEAAVKAFQTASGIEAVGFVGPQTRAALHQAAAVDIPSTSVPLAASTTSATPITTVNVPHAPISISVSTNYSQASLSWGAVANATFYNVKRRQIASSYRTVASTTNASYTDTSVTGGTNYYYLYLITALNSAGEGASSTEVAAWIPSPGGGGSPSDTTAPVLSAGSPSGTLAFGTTGTTLSVTTDESATCKYSTSSGTAFGSMTAFDTAGSTSHSSSITGLTNGASYIYYVKCQDSSGNTDTSEYTISFTVAPDTTPPSVSLTAPANGASVSGTSVTLSATASDNVAVAGVTFKVGGVIIGSEDTSSPYAVTWDSTATSSGSKSIVAVVRDTSGNLATSTAASVTVDNTAPVLSSATASTTAETTAGLSANTDEADGTLYWVVTTSATQPSQAQIKAGQDQSGSAAPANGSQAVTTAGTQYISGGAIGLAAVTAYYVHFMQEDVAANQSNVASSASFTSSITLDLNFAANTAFGNGAAAAFTDLLNITRASTGYAQSANGNWSSFNNNTLRITDLGLLVEASRTNSLRNNWMTGATNGAPGTIPTNWLAPGASASGLARTVGGVGDAMLGLPSITLEAAGTTSGTNVTALNPEQSTQIAALSGDHWSASVFLALTAGSLTNISSVQLRIVERNSSGTLLTSHTTNITPTATPTRFTATTTLSNVSTAFVSMDVIYNFSNGVPVDVTLQVAAPQLEKGTYVTSPIKSNGTTGVRQADIVTLNTSVPVSMSLGSVLVEWQDVAGPISLAGSIGAMAIDSNNLIHFSAHDTANVAAFFVDNASSFVVSLTTANPVVAGTTYRYGAAYQNNDFAVAFSHILRTNINTSNSGTIPTGTFTTYIGNNVTGSYLAGYIRRFIWSPYRITNTTLVNWAQANN